MYFFFLVGGGSSAGVGKQGLREVSRLRKTEDQAGKKHGKSWEAHRGRLGPGEFVLSQA